MSYHVKFPTMPQPPFGSNGPVVDEDTAEPLVWLDGPTTDELTDIDELIVGAADELVEDAADADEELENSAG